MHRTIFSWDGNLKALLGSYVRAKITIGYDRNIPCIYMVYAKNTQKWIYSAKIASGILYTWTGLGKSVHTGTYQYVLVQHGTRQYENLTVVRTGMYWYIPVRTYTQEDKLFPDSSRKSQKR